MYPFSTALFSSSVVHVPVRDRSWGECGHFLLRFFSGSFICCCAQDLHKGNKSLDSILYGKTGW